VPDQEIFSTSESFLPSPPSVGNLFSKNETRATSSVRAPQFSSDSIGREGVVMQQRQMVAPSMPLQDEMVMPVDVTGEQFPDAEVNPVKQVSVEPVSTFSIDVDTASYSVVRSSLNNGRLPNPDAVRVEELINYFTYDNPRPTSGHPFEPTVQVVDAPWSENNKLVHIAIQGEMPEVEDRPNLNLVFLIDTSGSMNQPNKLPLLKQSFNLMLDQLRPDDEVAIVSYAGAAGVVLEPTKASEVSKIRSALNTLTPGGGTAGQAGLETAYGLASEMSSEGEIGRVILATDGDFNIGMSSPDDMKDFISKKKEDGTYLSVLGFGRGNLNDALMQSLAQNGQGQAAYIDTLSEAQKVLVDQLTGSLYPIANDVKIQMEFNPDKVSEYRLIGYETRALRREDFNNDKVDAGDIGAGHSVTAIYEITPVGAPGLYEPLRYQSNAVSSSEGFTSELEGDAPYDVPVDSVEGQLPTVSETDDADVASDELGFLKLRYKRPGEAQSTLISRPVVESDDEVRDDVSFSIAIAGFGQLLSQSVYLGDWSWDDAIEMANNAKGKDEFGYRSQAVQLMRLAKSLD
jgi:Ca-activated chloride channel family protein